MARILFLTSAGLPQETSPDFLKILPQKPENLRVAFIPTAADPEEDKWFVESAKKELSTLGFFYKEVDLKENPQLIKNKLATSDIIYINGGNSFYLLDWIRKCGLDKYLDQLLDQGKIYVGVSAGSIVVGPNIELSGCGEIKDENIVKIKDLTGLKLVPFAVSPHYTKADRKILLEKSKTLNYPILALSDTQAVLVTGKEYHLVGKGEKVVFGRWD